MTPQYWIRGAVAAIAGILLVPAYSQTSSPPSSGGGGGASGGNRPTVPTGTGTSIPGSNSGNTNTTQQPPVQPPMRVSGRVVMEDGSELSFPAVIERVCNGSPHAEGYTDTKGYFSLVLGQNMEVIADASEVPSGGGRMSSNPGMPGAGTVAGLGSGSGRSMTGMGGISPYSSCELRAHLAGYVSQSLNLTGRSTLDNPDVGTILLHRMGTTESATTVTATTLKAPKAAHKALEKGLELAKKNKPEEAIASLREAVKIYPDFAYAWCELGKLQVANQHIPDAHESFEAAAKAEPRWPDPFLRLALMAVKAHDWREVADTTDHVLHLNSWEYPQAYFFNGAANFNLHHLDVAEKDALAAEKLDTQHVFPQIQQLLGMVYIERHRYADAAEKLRSYLLLAPDGEDAPYARQQLAVAERMAAQTLQMAKKKQEQ